MAASVTFSQPAVVSGGPDPERGFHVTVFQSFAEAEHVWRAATDNCVCFGFQCFEWQLTVHTTLGKSKGVQPCIVHVTDADGETQLLAPLGVIRHFGISILIFHGNHVTDYNAPLINPIFAADCTETAFRRLWVKILQKLPEVDLVWLKRMPRTIEGVTNPFVYLDRAVPSSGAWSAALPGTFPEFNRGRSPHFLADTVRQRRRLAEIGPIVFEIATSGAERRDTVALMLQQKQRRLLETKARLLQPEDCAFYEAMAVTPFQVGEPHVSRLRVGNQIVATHVGMLFQKRFYWLMPGYEGGPWARFSCGRLLLESVVRWCIDTGIESFDLTVGDEDYKRFWGDTRTQLYELQCGRTPKGAAVLAGWRLRRIVARSSG
jgi:CelD/BcsL family acetyltransferase involved in cellulose biosynthesis